MFLLVHYWMSSIKGRYAPTQPCWGWERASTLVLETMEVGSPKVIIRLKVSIYVYTCLPICVLHIHVHHLHVRAAWSSCIYLHMHVHTDICTHAYIYTKTCCHMLLHEHIAFTRAHTHNLCTRRARTHASERIISQLPTSTHAQLLHGFFCVVFCHAPYFFKHTLILWNNAYTHKRMCRLARMLPSFCSTRTADVCSHSPEVYMYIYIYMYVYMSIYMYNYTYIIYTYTYIHTHTMYIYIYIHICMYVCM